MASKRASRRKTDAVGGELTLVVAGPAGSGRTTVATIIAAALREAGAEVTVEDDEVVERFGPLTGKKIRVQVRMTPEPGAATLRLVK
jgi:ABC-type glutathione transport system ATPase component